jgi:hypothetical protein
MIKVDSHSPEANEEQWMGGGATLASYWYCSERIVSLD